MNIVRLRKIFYIFSGIIFCLSIASLATRGLNLGVDFRGDSLLEVEYKNTSISADDVRGAAEGGSAVVTSTEKQGDRRFLIRMDYLTEEGHQKVLEALRLKGEVEEKSFVSTGPSVGRELRRNAMIAIIFALVAIIIYIAFAFRKVSRPVSSWMYGVIAIIALLHDVFIPTGLFSFFQIQIDSLFVTALLTVLGFSVHDTIVVFDRIRENLRKSTSGSFEELVGKSVSETITRSINTSLTTVLSLTAIYFFGGVTTKNFALALIIGIIIGTYSSIFIASPLLVSYEKWRRKG
jgi:preprotein translocase subunit SecF